MQPDVSVSEAEALIQERMRPTATEDVTLAEAPGRTLRSAVRADRDQPPFDRVTMDGIAVDGAALAAGLHRFRIIATQGAGSAPAPVSRSGDCVEVMTGAQLPPGTDTVIPVERVRNDGGLAELETGYEPQPGQFVHRRGSDRRRGSVLLPAGTVIGPAETAVLASAGCVTVPVARIPSVAVVATGDELVVPGDPVLPQQIRSCNDWAVQAALHQAGFTRTSRSLLRDVPADMARTIAELHDNHDVLVLSGGVSMGKYDHVPAVLETLGVDLVFHKISQRPGRPMWFGISEQNKPVFALPGNPVSTLVCALRYVLPALRRMTGAPVPALRRARLSAPVEFTAPLTYFLPVRLSCNSEAVWMAEPRPTNTSGDFAALAGTDGFLELDRESERFPAGHTAEVVAWPAAPAR